MKMEQIIKNVTFNTHINLKHTLACMQVDECILIFAVKWQSTDLKCIKN